MGANTIALNKNIVTRKQLVGIANFVRRNSEARFLSRGTKILSTEQEIRTTKKAQVLIPLLQGIKDVQEVLAQAKNGSVKSTELSLNEFIVELANEKITNPIVYRPRDGEVIQASSIMERMNASYEVTATTAKDRAYYENILAQGLAGITIAVGGKALKSEIVESVLNVGGSTAQEIKDFAITFANQIRQRRRRIKMIKDKFLQGRISNKDIAIVVTAGGEEVLQNDARYNMYSEKAVNMNGALDVEIDGVFDGSPVLVSKQLPEGIDFIVMLFGSAVSLFALRQAMNMDKIPGVQAYLSSMEFDEGTGMFLPHMISIGVNKANIATYPAQDAVGFDALILDMNKSNTVSGNAGGTAGLPAPKGAGGIVGDDVNGDGNIGDGELVSFDATTWYSSDYATDKAELDAGQIRLLKQALGVAKNATDQVVQDALTADKANRV